MTLLVNNRDQVSFQLDTGAFVNILPYALCARRQGVQVIGMYYHTSHNAAQQGWSEASRASLTKHLAQQNNLQTQIHHGVI